MSDKAAKEVKQFSRRHRTSEAHDKAKELNKARQTTKLQNAWKREYEAANRPPREQLRRLDERLGAGVGAQKERARIKARIR